MKRYEDPSLKVVLFDAENIVTEGSQVVQPDNTAVDMALKDAKTFATEDNTFVVTF